MIIKSPMIPAGFEPPGFAPVGFDPVNSMPLVLDLSGSYIKPGPWDFSSSFIVEA